MSFTNTLSPFTIKNLDLKNRLVFPAIGTNFANSDGSLNEKILGHYEALAKSGNGLIITEITRIDKEYGTNFINQLRAESLEDVSKLSPLVERVHRHGSKIFLQLQHPGLVAPRTLLGGKDPLGPSSLELSPGVFSREMTEREIQVLINKFALGAKIGEDAGFDGVELHATHGYLLSQFLSPDTNKRTDKYGGNVFNRANILVEIISGIRQFCREDFIISIRINGDDFLENGMSLDDSTMVCKLLEEAGADVLNISSGTPRSDKSRSTIIEPKGYEEAWKKNLAKTIKENVGLPIIACNNIKNPETMEALLEDGVCDLLALGRAQLADYDFIKKTIEGKTQDINQCISCLACIGSLLSGGVLTCPINKNLQKNNA